ncbi:MAG: hypothetical protein NC828_02680, partial [Candidatus Omnitrophica bacterium]|nr:hypothetical protein [Candidatus Omnitrophota bacterium]
IISAGLIDGINPCAFTVIVFFISFLYLQGYRRRELELIGLSFILAVFLTYLFIGLGIFRFLYVLRHFYLFSKILYYLIATMCFILAGFSFYDLWLFKKTKKFEGLTLQSPQIIKNRIHSVISFHYRKTPHQESSPDYNRPLFNLIISAFITGFLVSLLEAVCTGQLYLPAITFMLKEPALKAKAFLYLIIYNFMFVVPLFIVFILALWGSTSEDFARFVKKHFIVIRIFMAGLFIILGFFIIVRA